MKQIKLWMISVILTSGFGLVSCTNDDDPVAPTPVDEVEAQLQKMTLREKVGQMFYVRPEVLDTTIHYGTSQVMATPSPIHITATLRA